MTLFDPESERGIILLHPVIRKFQSTQMERPFMDHKLDLNIATEALELAPFGVCITGSNNELLYGNSTLFNIFGIQAGAQINNLAQIPSINDAINNKEPYIELDSDTEDKKRTIKCWHHDSNQDAHTYFFLDVTDKKTLFTEKTLLEDELSRLNTRDELTGLPNKIALLQGLEPLVSRSRRYNNPLSIVHLELDLTNDGDQNNTITKLSHMLRDQMRWADMIGRLDENKFLLILPETPEDAASILVDKLSAKIEEMNQNQDANLRVFFGIANWTAGDDSRLMLKRAAENANQNRESSAA